MNIGPIVRVLNEVPATTPIERELGGHTRPPQAGAVEGSTTNDMAAMDWDVPGNVPVVKWQREELLAWRVWLLLRAPDDELRLASIVLGTVWEGPVLIADRRPLAAPGCSGVYALKPGTSHGRRQFDSWLGAAASVWGWVALSGQVVEHQFGYRAERVVIRRLRLDATARRAFRCPGEVAKLEQRYQCPVKISGVNAPLAGGFASLVYLRGMLSVRSGVTTWPAPSLVPSPPEPGGA